MSSPIRASDRLALQYIYGSVVHYRPGDKLPPRVLEDFELVLMIEGTASYHLGDEAWPESRPCGCKPAIR